MSDQQQYKHYQSHTDSTHQYENHDENDHNQVDHSEMVNNFREMLDCRKG